MSDDGERREDDAPHERRVDLDTPLENFCLGAVFGAIIGAFAVLFTGDVWLILNAVGVVVVAVLIRSSVDCTYFLNETTREIVYARSVFGMERREVVCRYDEVFAVAVDGSRRVSSSQSTTGSSFLRRTVTRRRYWWVYWAVLVLPDGRTVQISDKYPEDLGKANRRARWVSEEVGAPFVEGVGEHALTVSAQGGTLKIGHETVFLSWSSGVEGVAFILGLLAALGTMALFAGQAVSATMG